MWEFYAIIVLFGGSGVEANHWIIIRMDICGYRIYEKYIVIMLHVWTNGELIRAFSPYLVISGSPFEWFWKVFPCILTYIAPTWDIVALCLHLALKEEKMLTFLRG